jgi:hypothetical protein
MKMSMRIKPHNLNLEYPNTPRQAILLRDVSLSVREVLSPDCAMVVLCDYLQRKEYESSAY